METPTCVEAPGLMLPSLALRSSHVADLEAVQLSAVPPLFESV